MHFHINHKTEYVYSEPATEAFSELRMKPRGTRRQKVWRYSTSVTPSVLIESYTDYFGNMVETLSIPFRHPRLIVDTSCDVLTMPTNDHFAGIGYSISEARQYFAGLSRDLHDFLRPSQYVPFSRDLARYAARFLLPDAGFSDSIRQLNEHIFKEFKYHPGVTDVSSSAEQVLAKKEGVCQDFSHLMIALLRISGLPARYVSGYIETDPVPENPGSSSPETFLIGATASHAWVEVFTPNNLWVGIDPTNNTLEGERHVQIGVGRDYTDVAPLKGIFKGANSQRLTVKVKVSREDFSEGDSET